MRRWRGEATTHAPKHRDTNTPNTATHQHTQHSDTRHDSTPHTPGLTSGVHRYLQRKPEKKMHDPLAACSAIDPSINTFMEVQCEVVKGKWGSKPQAGTGVWITVASDRNKFYNVLTQGVYGPPLQTQTQTQQPLQAQQTPQAPQTQQTQPLRPREPRLFGLKKKRGIPRTQ